MGTGPEQEETPRERCPKHQVSMWISKAQPYCPTCVYDYLEAFRKEPASVALANLQRTSSNEIADLKKELNTTRGRLAQVTAEAQIAHDMHQTLGIHWGDDPHWAIETLRKDHARLVEENANAGSELNRLREIVEDKIRSITHFNKRAREHATNETKLAEALSAEHRKLEELQAWAAKEWREHMLVCPQAQAEPYGCCCGSGETCRIHARVSGYSSGQPEYGYEEKIEKPYRPDRRPGENEVDYLSRKLPKTAELDAMIEAFEGALKSMRWFRDQASYRGGQIPGSPVYDSKV